MPIFEAPPLKMDETKINAQNKYPTFDFVFKAKTMAAISENQNKEFILEEMEHINVRRYILKAASKRPDLLEIPIQLLAVLKRGVKAIAKIKA